jgi:oxygen-independent coproporphyrinogen-3 oxidase
VAGLYIHVPFRATPCLYDDSPVVLARPPHRAYLQAVQREIAHYADRYREPIRTVYIGGGRPSLLDLATLRTLLTASRDHFEIPSLEECTLELNPADADPAFLRGLRALGVDRLSLDVMSFYADDLATLQAPHTAEQAHAAPKALRDTGFQRFSVDLLFGWARQDPLHWKANLQKAARLGVPHLAISECTGEQLTEASEDRRADQYRFAMDFLPDHGYEHYEISHFARPGCRGLHNQRHWDQTNYLGVGPSAHSFWWDGLPAHRWANVRNLARYEALLNQHQPPTAHHVPLDLPALANEYVLLRLRTRDGLDLGTLHDRYGVDLDAEHADTLARLMDEGYLELVTDRRVRLTQRGMLYCDAVTQKLLPH